MPWETRFDIDATLEKAGETFWTKGYEATSMSDLLDAMGIQKGSFYNTYGSKHQAYLRALDQYTSARIGELEALVEGLEPVAALRAMFEALHDDCIGSNGHRGCMVINCALELAHEDAEAQAVVKRSIHRHEGLIRGLIEVGQTSGSIDPGLDAGATAKTMMALIMGMRVYSRSGSDLGAVRILADQALGLLRPPASAGMGEAL